MQCYGGWIGGREEITGGEGGSGVWVGRDRWGEWGRGKGKGLALSLTVHTRVLINTSHYKLTI